MAAVSGTPANLLSSPINILALREDCKAEFESILSDLPGKICLVVDPKLIAPLKLVITEGVKWMREHNVESVVELSTTSLSTECDTVLYLTRPQFPLMKLLAEQVKSFDARGLRRHLHVAFVPRRTFICESLLQELGVYGDIQTREFGLDMFALDDDVITMGLDNAFRDVSVANDTTTLFSVTKALLKIQNVYGLVPQVRAKGRAARQVLDMMLRLQREDEGAVDGGGGSSSSAAAKGIAGGAGKETKDGGFESFTVYVGKKSNAASKQQQQQSGAGGGGGPGAAAQNTATASAVSQPATSEIDMMVILDRAVDLVTPLVTPLTMEALLHEFIGIENAMVKVDAALVQQPDDDLGGKSGADADDSKPKTKSALPPGSKLSLHLNSNDKLYSEIRDLNISTAGPHLTNRAKELQGFREQIKKSKDLEVSDIHKFVKAIPTLQQDLKSLRVLVELATLMNQKTNDPAFVSRWQLERSLLEEENQKEVQEQVSTAVARRAPLLQTLRLLCLDSQVEGGLKRAAFDQLRRDIANSYGFASLFTLENLEKAGLLTSRDGGLGGLLGGSSGWGTVRKNLQLLTDDARVDAPTDIHFVTSGYAPLSVRIVQAAVTTGWTRDPQVAEALRQLPGPAVQVTQIRRSEAGGAGGGSAAASAAAAGAGKKGGKGGAGAADGDADDGAAAVVKDRKVVLVCYVGGVTHIEISALRFMSEKYPVDFIVLATSIISGHQLLQSLSAEGDVVNGLNESPPFIPQLELLRFSEGNAVSVGIESGKTTKSAAAGSKGSASSAAGSKAGASSSSAAAGGGAGGKSGFFGFGGGK